MRWIKDERDAIVATEKVGQTEYTFFVRRYGKDWIAFRTDDKMTSGTQEQVLGYGTRDEAKRLCEKNLNLIRSRL